jgi:hypothetical protein
MNTSPHINRFNSRPNKRYCAVTVPTTDGFIDENITEEMGEKLNDVLVRRCKLPLSANKNDEINAPKAIFATYVEVKHLIHIKHLEEDAKAFLDNVKDANERAKTMRYFKKLKPTNF